MRGIIEVVGRYEMASVVAFTGMFVGTSGDLLAALGDVRVFVKRTAAPKIALVTLGVVAEFHRTATVAIEPDGETLVIEAQHLGERWA